jgi:hypothetical protein
VTKFTYPPLSNLVFTLSLYMELQDHWFTIFCTIDVQTSMTSVWSIVLVHKRQNHCTVATANFMASNITVHIVKFISNYQVITSVVSMIFSFFKIVVLNVCQFSHLIHKCFSNFHPKKIKIFFHHSAKKAHSVVI